MNRVTTHILTIEIKIDSQARVYDKDVPLAIFKGKNLLGPGGGPITVTAHGENFGIIKAEIINFLEKS